MLKFLKDSTIVILITVLITLLFEVIAIYYNRTSADNVLTDNFEFRLSKPSAYLNSPYFSKNFVSDSMNTAGVFYTPENSRLILVKNYYTDLIKVEGGDRKTYPDIRGRKKIFIFGGSTIFSAEVPDLFTIPSLLSQYVMENESGSYQIINKGVTSVNTSQQLEYLKTVDIGPDDIVVFYGGVNDIFQGLYFGSPEGTIIGEQRKIDQITKRQKINGILSYSNIYEGLTRYAAQNFMPDYLKNPDSLNQLSLRVEENYLKYIRLADQHVKSKGARFINILQPNLFTLNSHSKYEEYLKQERILKALKVSFEKGNGVLMGAFGKLKEEGVESYDFSNSLNSKEEDCFLDVCHVTEICNSIVAEKIYESIFSRAVPIKDRSKLNKEYDEYLKDSGLEFLAKNYIPKKTEVIERISDFNLNKFSGTFDERLLSHGFLKQGFISKAFVPMKFFKVDLDVDCKKSEGVFFVVNSEDIKNESKGSLRRPLVCGKNELFFKLSSVPDKSGFVIESSENEIKINLVVISRIDG